MPPKKKTVADARKAPAPAAKTAKAAATRSMQIAAKGRIAAAKTVRVGGTKASAKPQNTAKRRRAASTSSDDDGEDDDDDEIESDAEASEGSDDNNNEEGGDNAAPLDDRALVLGHLGNMRRIIGSAVRHLGVGAVPSGGGADTGAEGGDADGEDKQQTLLCREQQVSTILRFLQTDAHPTLQLFGMPGTGKTAAVRHAVSLFARQQLGLGGSRHDAPTAAATKAPPTPAPRGKRAAASAGPSGGGGTDVVSVVFFNGYVMQRPTDVFATLLRHLTRFRLGGGTAAAAANSRIAPHQAAAQLERRFTLGWAPAIRRAEDIPLCVIVIDEMDKCCEHSGKTLFRLVDWLTLPYARCKMITIANAMQLPERLDAKTRSRLNTTQRVTFPSYSPEQLQHILAQRLAAARANPSVAHLASSYNAMSPAAAQYICRQIGLHNGDVRRLLQTTAAALQDVLVLVEDLSEKVTAAAQLTVAEANVALEALGLPTAEEASGGIAQVRHLSAVARNVLHDRFQDFLATVESPFVYTIVLIVASESIRQAALQRSELAASHLPLDRLYLIVRATIEAHATMGDDGGRPPPISMTQFLLALEALRQVNFIELPVGDSEATLRDATTATRVSEPVSVTIVHPPQDIVARCEGHPLFESIGKHILKRHQL